MRETIYPVRFTVILAMHQKLRLLAQGGSSYNLSDIVTILIDAEDSDGSVTAVEVFNGPFLLGRQLEYQTQISNSTTLPT